MKLQWFKLFFPAFALAFTGTVSAAVVIDQDNTQLSEGIMSSFLNGSQVQSFQQSASNIAGAGILLEGSGSDSITINLYDLLPLPESGATLLATGSAVGVGGSWVDVYWGEVSISPDTTYYLEFSGSDLATTADLQNRYSRGIYYSSSLSGFPAYDLIFRTYANDTVVPEPGTYVMFLAGMGMIGAITRRRNLNDTSPAA
jgi:hypothetical protein